MGIPQLTEAAELAGISPIELGDLLFYVRRHMPPASNEYDILCERLDRIAQIKDPVQRAALAAELCGPYMGDAISLALSREIVRLTTSRTRPFPFQKIINIFNPTK